MRRRHVLTMAVAAGCVLAPTAAAPQNVDPAVDDLRGNDVTFEEEALTFDELDQLDAVTHRLQDDGGYLKVIVLKDAVTDYDTARDYPDDVRDELGGDGRIVVYTPNEVAVSSNVDPDEQVNAAERAAADTLNAGRSLDAATLAAAEELGVEPGSGEPASIPWGFILIMIAVPVGLLVVLWLSARKRRRQATALSAEEIGAAEKTVRATVDEAANDLLELADRVDQPGAPAEARDAFGLGAQLFSVTQEELEQADTRGELEAVYPRVVEAGWRLDTARALLDGQPAPAKPDPPPLLPPDVVAVPVTVPAGEPVPAEPSAVPEPHYRQSGASPWITAAAMAAMAMLAQRGMSTPTNTRPPMDDGGFGTWTSGLPRSRRPAVAAAGVACSGASGAARSAAGAAWSPEQPRAGSRYGSPVTATNRKD